MPKGDQLRSEQEHQRRAFEHYAAQTGRRCYQATADSCRVSLSTVKLWSRSFGWRQRLRERDAQQARQLSDRMAQGQLDDSERNLKIVRMALVQLAKDIHDRKIKGQIADVERLIRLEQYLRSGDGRLCRDPSHRVLDEVQAMNNIDQLNQFLIDTMLSFFKDPEYARRALAALVQHGYIMPERLRRTDQDQPSAEGTPSDQRSATAI